MVAALLCVIIWSFVSIWEQSESLARPYVLLWNGLSRLAIFAFFVFLLHWLRDALAWEKEMASKDPLTGAFNRRHFYLLSDQEIERARSTGQSFTVAYFDLDGFKEVNDITATEVNDVHRSSGRLGEAHEVMNSFSFDSRRAAVMMPFRSGSSACDKLLLRFRHERFVFAMGSSYNSEFLCQFQGLIEFAVVDSKRPLVGEEDLERLDPGGDDLSQLSCGIAIKARNSHVERIVARRFPRACAVHVANPSLGSIVRDGQHMSKIVVVPPTRAAFVPVS
jgi:hypothetical protein